MVSVELSDWMARLGFSDWEQLSVPALQTAAEGQAGVLADGMFRTLGGLSAGAPGDAPEDAPAARLQSDLREWLLCVLKASRNGRYLELHFRIARLQEELGVPQALLLRAMAQLRHQLTGVVLEVISEPRQQSQALRTLGEILDLELAFVLTLREAEREERYQAQGRLAEVGALSASLAHDLRNPLSTLTTSLYLARQTAREHPDSSGLLRHLDRMGEQLDVCALMVSSMLSLARGRAPERTTFPLGPLVTEALGAVVMPSGIQVRASIADGIQLSADRIQLRQLLINLFQNARDALGQSGSVWVDATSGMEGLEIAVGNNGPMIPASDQSRLFNPLFTQKSHGTGLGLFLCRRIAEAHGGSIALEPTPLGALFKIWLPNPIALPPDLHP